MWKWLWSRMELSRRWVVLFESIWGSSWNFLEAFYLSFHFFLSFTWEDSCHSLWSLQHLWLRWWESWRMIIVEHSGSFFFSILFIPFFHCSFFLSPFSSALGNINVTLSHDYNHNSTLINHKIHEIHEMILFLSFLDFFFFFSWFQSLREQWKS